MEGHSTGWFSLGQSRNDTYSKFLLVTKPKTLDYKHELEAAADSAGVKKADPAAAASNGHGMGLEWISSGRALKSHDDEDGAGEGTE